MRNTIVLALVALVVLGAAGFAADPAPTTTTTTPAAAPAAAPAKPLPNPEMNLTTQGALPATFRGGDPDSGLVHVLEDAKYKRQEHTLLYDDTPEGIGESAKNQKWAGPPTINWTTERVGADGQVQVQASENNNSATNESEFPEPGDYRVGNSGARQTSGGAVETSDNGTQISNSGQGSNTPGDGQTGEGAQGANQPGLQTPGGGQTGEGAQGANQPGLQTPGGTGQTGGAGQRLTSTQTMGVKCHDCTSPNLWVVFQERAGKTDNLAANEDGLKDQLAGQMEANKGTFGPETQLSGGLEDSSMLAIYEFPKNVTPLKKTAAVAVKGPLFDETGKKVSQVASEVKAKVLDQESQTRLVEVSEDALKGVYVRRNVPFLVAAQINDNGEFKKGSTDYRIENKDTGEVVEKVDGAYMFRVPNYPRGEYADQPTYQFVMEGQDDSGNKTVVKVPLYVVNTQVSYEGGQNQ